MNQIIKNTIILFAITLIAGICLGAVHDVTLEPIAQAQEAAATATYQEVYPDAASFARTDEMMQPWRRQLRRSQPSTVPLPWTMPSRRWTAAAM